MNDNNNPNRPDAIHVFLSPMPRIYVASLADYTAGRLHGAWIDADQPVEAIQQEIQAMLDASVEGGAEEWVIHDYEGFGSLDLGEYEAIESIAEVASLTVEHGRLFPEILSHLGGMTNLDEAKQYMTDRYYGEWSSLAEYAEDALTESYGESIKTLPGIIRYAIDWERVGRDLELGGEIIGIEFDQRVHVFSTF